MIPYTDQQAKRLDQIMSKAYESWTKSDKRFMDKMQRLWWESPRNLRANSVNPR